MVGHTDRYFTRQPDFPFGYGLSYTTVRYADLELSTRDIGAGEDIAGRVRVTNNGSRAGEEVVQLYSSHPGMSLVDEEGRRAVMRGRMVLYAGGGQPGYAPTLEDSITITSELPLPR
jgi:beta-glucosidase